ncbi:hypothetical protein [Euhalothece natronophila]|uniref:hypothetical protein n=1 Tax=Euhalothece natronophila TaxID=577489 RepID=UPI001C993E36|nr:hypothetical protein [Euhalothece natronophila]
METSTNKTLILLLNNVKSLPLVITLLLLFPLTSCTNQAQIYRIRDITRNQQLLIRNQALSQSTYGLMVMSRGYIDGEARVTLLLDGQVRKTKVVSGNVRFQWRKHWNDNRAIVRYQPRGVTEGELRFNVTFMD